MIQIYLLSIIYMIISSIVLLLDRYRQKLLFFLRFRALLEENSKALNAYFIVGLTIGLMNLLFPIQPGPMILGDLVPSLMIIFISLYLRIIYSERYKDKSRFYLDENGSARERLGKITLLVAFIHFLIPSFVLL